MKTKFDHWLKETFAVETHIYLLNDPGRVPFGVKKIRLKEGHKSRHNFLLVIKNQRKADLMVRVFQQNHIACKTAIVDRSGAFAKYINNHPTLVFGCIWKLIILCLILAVGYWGYFVFWPEYQDSSEKANSNERIKLDKTNPKDKPVLK